MIKAFILFVLALPLCSLIASAKKDKPLFYKKINHYPFGDGTTDTYKMRYESDKLEIDGYLVRPSNIDKNEKLPLIIYNRGGNRDFGSIDFVQLKFLNFLSQNGYVVMASQYRGNLYSEGQDEFGGADVKDVIQLIEVAKSFKFIDLDNVGSLGISRGGLMSLLLSKKTDLIKTHVCIGTPSNLFQSIKERPPMYHKVYRFLIGDTLDSRDAYIKRSPIYWADQINEPVLLIHGKDDQNVGVNHAISLSDSLKAYQMDYELTIIEGGNHSLTSHIEQRNKLIFDWFEKKLKPNH